MDLISFSFKLTNSLKLYHWQTTSYARHITSGQLFDLLIVLLDKLVETYQGKYGVIMDYTNFALMQYQSCEAIQEYFRALNTTVEVLRQDIPDSYLQNQIDGVIELIQSTLYKLKHLR